MTSCLLCMYKFVSTLYFVIKCVDRNKRLYFFNSLVFLSSVVSVHTLLNTYLYVPVTNIYLAQTVSILSNLSLSGKLVDVTCSFYFLNKCNKSSMVYVIIFMSTNC